MPFPERLPIPEEVLAIARRLEGAGHETWCVGGAVRDNLLGVENKDFDLATAATPEQVQALFERTIPIGIKHGTVAVLDKNRQPHEVTTFRRDVTTDGRHAEVRFGVSLEEDLARRDFTINAIAYHPLRHEWRDPFSGANDLESGVIRAVGDPRHRFREDYLRILRALRFAARFGFEIEPATWEAARASIEGIRGLSAERVREEWFGGLREAERPGLLLELWSRVGALGIWVPEIEGGRDRDQRVWNAVMDGAPGIDPVLMTAALSDDPVATLERFKCSRAEIRRGRVVAKYRRDWPDPADVVAVRRWMARVGEAVDDLLGVGPLAGGPEGLARVVGAVRKAGDPVSLGQLAVTGDDLVAMGVEPGPEVGRVLARILDHVLENPQCNTVGGLAEIVYGGRD